MGSRRLPKIRIILQPQLLNPLLLTMLTKILILPRLHTQDLLLHLFVIILLTSVRTLSGRFLGIFDQLD